MNIIRPYQAGVRHGNQIDVFELPEGARPDSHHLLERTIERFPGLLEKIETANKIPVVMDRKGILRKIDTTELLILAKRRKDRMDNNNQNLLDKNAEFAQKIFDKRLKEEGQKNEQNTGIHN
jgi:hypothetical protein